MTPSRRIRNDASLEIQPAIADAPPQPVVGGPLADLVTLAASYVANYERPGWDEKKSGNGSRIWTSPPSHSFAPSSSGALVASWTT
jgi:hypothetical protein